MKKRAPAQLKFHEPLTALRNERCPDGDLKLQFEAVSRLDPEEKRVIRSGSGASFLPHEPRRWSAADSGDSR